MLRVLSSNPLSLFLFTSIVLLLTSQNIGLYIFFLILSSLLFFDKENLRINLNCFFIGSIAAIFFMSYWNTYYGSNFYLGLKSDDFYYDTIWSKGFLESYGLNLFKIPDYLDVIEKGLGNQHNSKGYVSVIIVLRWFSSLFDGYSTLYPRILNIFFLLLTAIYSSKITYYYTKNNKTKILTKLMVFFFPVMLFNSVHIFRDTIVSYIVVFIFYKVLTKNKDFKTWLIIIPILFFLFYLRVSTLIVLSFIIMMLLINPKKINLLLLFLVPAFFYLSLYLIEDQVLEILRKVIVYQTVNVDRFGYIGSQIFDLPILVGVIPRFIYLLFSPVPNFSSFHQIFISISALLQIFFFPYLFYSFNNKFIDIKIKITFLILFIAVALSTATFRHVMIYIPFGIILTILSYYYLNKQTSNNLSYYFGPILILMLLFLGSIFLVNIY